LKTVNSLSGGKTSSYIAANYPADYNVFALVRIEDTKCTFPDKEIRKRVEDKIKKPFIATAEMDTIIYTMFDLEQYIGKEIHWVSGPTFEEVIAHPSNNVLPSTLRRYCTAQMKVAPIFDWWLKTIAKPSIFNIGFRANEQRRAKSVLERTVNGLLEQKHITGKSKNGRNKWSTTSWQRPEFPLIKDRIYKDTIENFWSDKPVRFAQLNNCVGCFHRNEVLLKKMWDEEPKKMQWFANQEKGRKYKNDTFKMDNNITYEKIKQWKPQIELSFDDFSECDSGYCGL